MHLGDIKDEHFRDNTFMVLRESEVTKINSDIFVCEHMYLPFMNWNPHSSLNL